MKFSCASCGGRYRSSQELSEGQSVKFRCKKCGTKLSLSSDMPIVDGYRLTRLLDTEPPTAPTLSVSAPPISKAPVSDSSPKQLTAQERRNRLEKSISARAHEFEILPLLRVLESIEYFAEDILFCSSGNATSSGTVVAGVEFSKNRNRQVRVRLNLGLLGPDGLLPSYFHQMIEKMPDPDLFFDFIHFFDHWLIRQYVFALYPSLNQAVLGDWEKLKRSYLGMLGMTSVASLQWIFQLYFPELTVEVKRESLSTSTESYAFRTGESLLDGTGIIGKQYQTGSCGFRVSLIAPEEHNDLGVIWPQLVKTRLEASLFPVLRAYKLPLNIHLRVKEHSTWAGVQADGFLGYDRIRGIPGSGHQVIVYRGVVD